MTQIFLPSGEVVPVTKIQAGPCQVTFVKDGKKDNITAIQLGFDKIADWRLAKPQAGHLKDLEPIKWIRDFKIDSVANISRGDTITVDTFQVGDKVEVIGISKGKGFAGVVKRHHFHGGPASHGHKDNLRAPGSIGAGGVQRVFKDMRMAGRMGGDQVVVKNLEIIEVRPETNELFIKGAVPGGRNSLLAVRGHGELKVIKKVNQDALKEGVELQPTAVVSEEVKN